MFIRWQTHKSGGRQYSRETTRVRAILAKSVRVDCKSRPQYVTVIGSFVAEMLDVEARRDFWKAADERLSIYVNDDDRGKIEAVLARRVPPLTAEEEAAWQRQADESLMRRDDAMPSAIGRLSAPEHPVGHSASGRSP